MGNIRFAWKILFEFIHWLFWRLAFFFYQAELEAQEREAREAEARRNAPPPKGVQTSEDAQTLSSSEFDKFLSERATAGSQRVASQKDPPRQMTNVASGESTTDEMFAL